MNKNLLFTLLILSIFVATGCTVPTYVQGLLEYLIPALGVGIAGLITLGFKYLTDWLKAKSKNESLNHAIVVATEHVETIATEMVDEYQATLLAAMADGKIDEEEKAALKAVALDTLKERFSAKELKNLAKGMGLNSATVLDYLSSKLSGTLGSQLQTAIDNALLKEAVVPAPVAKKRVASKNKTTAKKTTRKKKSS